MLSFRWAYDPYARTCWRFIWGGCGGNKNNFLTPDACYKACGYYSKMRQCKHTYAFEDYTDWPDKDLYTSQRAPSGRHSRRMNINNNTQNVVQKIIINKQLTREIYVLRKITINKQLSQRQDSPNGKT